MGYPSKPILKSTEKEYLLFIHPSLKERAKVVSGYSWDARRKCWVYPHTSRIYDGLISEFGDDLDIEISEEAEACQRKQQEKKSQPDSDHKIKPTAPQAALDATPPAVDASALLQQTNQTLHDEVAKLRESIQALAAGSTGNQDESGFLKERLLARENEVASLLRKVTDTEEQLEILKRTNRDLTLERDSLGNALKARSSAESNEHLLKGIAIDATGKDAKFRALMSRVHLDRSLPLQVHKQLEKELCAALGITDDDRSHDMMQLIQCAYDKGVLPKDAVDHAHTIRKQRNLLAHADGYEKTYEARIIICLMAASLLWPELPE